MYVCICNALKHNQLKAAAAEREIASVPDLFRSCGARPRCGRCLDDMADLMSAVRQPDAAAIAAE